ncbi:hypothetical protein [uncultured Pedobacter sp.]|uniref:hypothetical protein n=1 Tax=uncultured Pedobacter sp. TaxID=246139 RepID=UPI0025DA0EB2|nr:hypothetical protein [uncultured Pedobacter sp.]
MKNLLVITLALLMVISCKKQPSNISPLAGKWELKAAIDGLTGTKKVVASGKGNTFIFTDKEYEKREDGKVVKTGSYSIKAFTSMITGRQEKQILFDGRESETKNYFTINHDTLTLSLDAYDASSTIYVKIPN